MAVTVRKPKLPLNLIIMDVLDKVVAVRGQEELETLANDVRQKLVDKIRDDSFHFAEYSDEYANWKKTRHPGAPFLMATGDYVDAIEVLPIKNGYSVGVRDEQHFGEDGGTPIQMRDLAKVLEYGSPKRHIPPRPHWRPALANLRRRKATLAKEMEYKLRKDIQKAMKEYLSQDRNFELRHYGK